MARSLLAAAVASLFLLAGAGSALGAHSASYEECRSASSSSYSGSKCNPGRFHSGPGMARNVLFYTAHDGHCPDATLAPSSHDLARVRAATLCLVNRERARHGERPCTGTRTCSPPPRPTPRAWPSATTSSTSAPTATRR